MTESSTTDNGVRAGTWEGDPTARYQATPVAAAYPQFVVPMPAYAPAGYLHPVAVIPQPSYSNGLGTTGMILGIIGLVLFWLPWFGFLLGLLGTVFGGIGIGKANKGEANNKGTAVAGLVTGLIAMTIWFIVFLAMVSAASSI
jgi:hypothetical protein